MKLIIWPISRFNNALPTEDKNKTVMGHIMYRTIVLVVSAWNKNFLIEKPLLTSIYSRFIICALSTAGVDGNQWTQNLAFSQLIIHGNGNYDGLTTAGIVPACMGLTFNQDGTCLATSFILQYYNKYLACFFVCSLTIFQHGGRRPLTADTAYFFFCLALLDWNKLAWVCYTDQQRKAKHSAKRANSYMWY